MKVIAAIKKEWLLLWRDKIGLIILFILPMCLVLFISLTSVQEGGNQKQTQLPILLINQDKGALGKQFKEALAKVSLFNITTAQGSQNTVNYATKAVKNASYSLAVIIPSQMSEHTQRYLQTVLSRPNNQLIPPPPIRLLIDPGLPVPLKDNIVMTVDLISAKLETAMLMQMQMRATKNVAPPVDFIQTQIHYVNLADAAKLPNSVQYNVPAWTLFGMFFIVIPLAGVMVRERESGVHQRLEIAPTWHLTLILGRILAFVGLNLIQLVLMLAVGVYILPLFDMPTLEVAHHISLILITGLCASFAATGFGLLIGTWATTYEQATVLGPFLIVIAAAIGGIMAPVNLMPSFLQKISDLSPLNWAQDAFINIFVKNAHFAQLIPDLLKLFGFFLLMLILSLAKLLRKN